MASNIKTWQSPFVYLVDSDTKLQLSLAARLRRRDIIVNVFSSSESFLNSKLNSRAACLIVEVNLPKMDGIELIENINNQGVRLPTLVLSSSGNLQTAVRAMQADALDFIEKPFLENTLVEKVLEIVNQSRL